MSEYTTKVYEENKRLAAENAALRKAMDRYSEAEMMAENAALCKDAERYRWLRHGDNDEPCLKFTQESSAGTDDAWLLRGHELDAAIDAAMKETP